MARRIVLFILTISAVLTFWHAGFAPAQSAPPARVASPRLELAAIYGYGDTLKVIGLPIMVRGEKVAKRYDVTCTFQTAEDGSVRVADLTSVPSAAAPNDAAKFIAGKYLDNGGGKFTVSGPALLSGGRTTWVLRRDDGRQRFDAMWTTGPAEGNPQLVGFGGINALPADFTYGRATYQYSGITERTETLGVRQVKDTVVITYIKSSVGIGNKPVIELDSNFILHRADD